MFELKQHHEVVQLLSAGAGLTMKAGMKQTHELIQMASAASAGGGQLSLTGLGLRPHHELVQIASAGKGRVVFED